MAITPGTILGRYRLTQRIGTGGMSEVWRADDQTLHRPVAVKVMHDPIAQSQEFVERFLREARLVAGLEHMHILPVYDFGTAEINGTTLSYLVMPLVAGSLKDKMKGTAIPPAQAVPWLMAVAQALDHSHSKGVMHRDVKPANVLMDANGRLLLADFGLARSMSSVSGLTASGAVMGTPWYMAPEQATGKVVGPAADQYALAVTAFQMLSGEMLFHADSPLGVLAQHMTAAPPPLSEVLSGTRSEVDQVLLKALEKDPAQRFPSCAAFVAALGKAYGLSSLVPTALYGPPPLEDRTDAINMREASPAGPQPTEILPQTPPPIPPPPPRGSAIPTRPMPEQGERPGMTAPPSVVVRGTGGRPWLPFAVIAGLVALGLLGVLLLRNRDEQAEPQTADLQPTAAPAAPTVTPLAVAVEPTQAPAPTAAETTEPPPTPAVVAPTAAVKPPEPREQRQPTPPREDRTAERRDKEPRQGGYDREEREDTGGPAPRGESILKGSSLSADSTLSSAWESLNASRKRDGRLEREDFVSAMGEARRAMSRRDTPEVRFLDAYARAGVAFADGRTTDAWQLLRTAMGDAPGEVRRGKKARLVGAQLNALGPQPGPDGGWIMGLAFSDVRGDLDEELRKAEERAPESARIAWARALHAADLGRGKQARRWARKACEGGISDACGY